MKYSRYLSYNINKPLHKKWSKHSPAISLHKKNVNQSLSRKKRSFILALDKNKALSKIFAQRYSRVKVSFGFIQTRKHCLLEKQKYRTVCSHTLWHNDILRWQSKNEKNTKGLQVLVCLQITKNATFSLIPFTFFFSILTFTYDK